jgi:thiol-disulfide isomerase/thioredoxin
MRRIILLAVTLLSLVAPVRGEDLSQFKTADDLWTHINQLEGQGRPRDPVEFSRHVEDMRSALLEFQARCPTNDTRRWDAKLLLLGTDSMRAEVQDRPQDFAGFLQIAKEVVAAPDATPPVKQEARLVELSARVQLFAFSGTSSDRAVVDAEIARFRKDYPDDASGFEVQFDLARILQVRDPDAAEKVLRELEGSQNIQVAARAQQQMERFQRERKLAKTPLDLKFQAVDGTEVDLAKLRGKVVLLDFWATWCGPCRVEIPNVVATYNQFHKDGFEIIGVSLDQSKAPLLKYTKQAGMTWPEYFDGKGWANEVSSRYGINSIPAAWLVDKKGFVRTTGVRGADLAQQVKMLLAE